MSTQLGKALLDAGYDVPLELVPHIEGYTTRRLEDLREIQRLFRDAQYSDIRRITHNIKGNAASYGFSKLAEVVIGIEHAIETSDFTRAGSMICDMEAELAKISKAIQDQKTLEERLHTA